MRKCFLAVLGVSLILVAVSSPLAAAASRKAPSGTTSDIRADLGRILSDAGKDTVVGVRIVTLTDTANQVAPEVLYSAQAEMPMVPASNMKLVTTGAAFDRLGPDWRIRTYIGHVPSAGKEAPYDLVVIGGGDPNFSTHAFTGDSVGAFRRWADILKARTLKSVGRIILDDSLFDDLYQHPNWPANQSANWYEAPIGALNVNDNCVDVRITPGQVGEPAAVRLEPAAGYAPIDGIIMTVADRKSHGFSIERLVVPDAPAAMRLKVSGRFYVKAPEALEYRTVVNPTLFFGAALTETLRAEGIEVAGPLVREKMTDATGAARPDFTCDLVHTSRIDATAAVANQRSQGMFAECLLKILGAYGSNPKPQGLVPPTQGSWVTGSQEACRWLVERGIPGGGCVIDDGSGLSKQNRLTALCLSELLRLMYERHGEAFLQTLAEPGSEGTLAKRMRNTPAEGRVFAKTGYVSGVSALAGYVRAKSGKIIVFSILMNNVHELWKAREVQDKVCLRLVEY
jgi:D-alanyl-D-alanine carboxypeptidase/D-alanyl-D-alanine-endopeptidase (penicillin-binding protein 4)